MKMQTTQTKLWYRQPARIWEEALPLGNGRIGAMVFSGVEKEVISLNEDTLWSGYPRNTDAVKDSSVFQKARALAMEGKLDECQSYIEQEMTGRWSESYLPLGNLCLEFLGQPEGEPADYCRSLCLHKGVVGVSYTQGGYSYERECFVSAPHDGLVMRLKTNAPQGLSLKVTLDTQLQATSSVLDGALVLDAECPGVCMPPYVDTQTPILYEEDPRCRGICLRAMAGVQAVGGNVCPKEGALVVENAREVLLRFTVKTSFNGFDKHPFLEGKEYRKACEKALERLNHAGYEELLDAHLADFVPLFEQNELCLGESEQSYLPTDERLKNYTGHESDPSLIPLLFNFGRYLILSASREGTQPTNLQGIWNRHIRPPWSSNYTININTEMNYWPVLPCGYFACHEPMVRLLREMCRRGSHTAQVYFGARGFTAFHNTDIWRLTNPVGTKREGCAVFAYWPMAAGWMSRHLMEQYDYTLDEAYLRETAYPILKQAALFLYDILTEDETGRLIACPSTSPENHFFLEGKDRAVAKTTTMTMSIIRDNFEIVCRAAEVLDVDEEFVSQLRDALGRLAPYQIGSKGQLLEWSEEYEEVEPHHRHTSHLYSLHPGHDISPRKTPELAEACRRSLQLRGDDGTGWSLGWKINHWARLLDGDHALKLLERQLRLVDTSEENMQNGGGTYPNLFDAHPPFQIDGNFGAVAGVCEMLLQNEDGVIYLLPALPAKWRAGTAKGIFAKGGVKLDLQWKNCELAAATVTALRDTTVRLSYRGTVKTIELKAGECRILDPGQFAN